MADSYNSVKFEGAFWVLAVELFISCELQLATAKLKQKTSVNSSVYPQGKGRLIKI